MVAVILLVNNHPNLDKEKVLELTKTINLIQQISSQIQTKQSQPIIATANNGNGNQPQEVFITRPVPVYLTQTADVRIVNFPAPTPNPQPQPMTTTIQIGNTRLGYDLNKQYYSRNTVLDELNYIDIAAIVRIDGQVDKESTVEITATDSTQNKTEVGTADIGRIQGDPNQYRMYSFRYVFKTPEDHTITFSTNGVSESVTFHVLADER